MLKRQSCSIYKRQCSGVTTTSWKYEYITEMFFFIDKQPGRLVTTVQWSICKAAKLFFIILLTLASYWDTKQQQQNDVFLATLPSVFAYCTYVSTSVTISAHLNLQYYYTALLLWLFALSGRIFRVRFGVEQMWEDAVAKQEQDFIQIHIRSHWGKLMLGIWYKLGNVSGMKGRYKIWWK